MEKHLQTRSTITIPGGGTDVTAFTLEGGEEECQIKRIVLSATELSSEFGVTCKVGLFQKQPTTLADFSDDTIIYSMTYRNQQLINETTTVRVPQGWFIGTLLINNDPVNSAKASCNLQLNYLSLG